MRNAQITLVMVAVIAALAINGILRPDLLGMFLIGGGLLLLMAIAIFLQGKVSKDLTHQLSVKEGQLQALNSKLNQLEHRLDELNTLDEVSGCFNRRHFSDLIKHHRGMAERGQYTFTVCATEVDNYGELIDKFGNSKGDEILRLVGSILKSAVREIDLVARIEGAQFGVILAGANEQVSVDVLTRVAHLISQIQVADEAELSITASAGVAEFSDTLGETDLFDHAINALQFAIDQGRNRVAAHMSAAATAES